MLKDQVIFLREKIRKADSGITVYSDNMIISQEHINNCAYLIWDDTRELMYNIKSNRNPDYKEQNKFPTTVQVSGYDTIQYMGNSMDEKSLIEFFDSLITDGILTEDNKEKMLEDFKVNKIL